MKHLLTILFFLSQVLLFSQTNEIDLLKQQRLTARGSDYVSTGIALSKLYFQEQEYEKAVEAAEKATKLARTLDDPYALALALNTSAQALLYIKKGRFFQQSKALRRLQESVRLLEGTGNDSLLIDNLRVLQRFAISKGRNKEARDLKRRIRQIQEDEELASVLGRTEEETYLKNRRDLKEKAKETILEFKETNEDLNDQLKALNLENEELERILEGQEMEIDELSEAQMIAEFMLMQQRNLVDSLHIKSLQDSMLLSKQEMDIQMKESQLEVNKSQRNLLIAIASIVVILGISFYTRYRGIKRYSAIIEKEKKRSEDLLLNILPAPIAEELKREGSAQARQYQEVTVLFSDFKNFSKIASVLSPAELVAALDYCFKEFDKIVEKFNLEKIKTIGDAYMCAGGLPVPDPSHPHRVIQAALDMQAFLEDWKQERINQGLPFFEARLGIHTGPIIAGVVGVKKFAYDIWGDTVNVASRMESSGETGRVNISASTYAKIKDKFNCVPRGKVPAKNYGEIDMYFVQEDTFMRV